MAKTLVLAEKPSVGKELARVLGCKRGGDGCLEGDRYIVTWALGHLVTLADPEVYDKKLEKWSMEDLPMLPQTMKLVVIPETSRQYKVVTGLMKRSPLAQRFPHLLNHQNTKPETHSYIAIQYRLLHLKSECRVSHDDPDSAAP